MALSILIIDDEPGIRKTLGISLRAEGHQVTAVSNIKEALIEADRRYYDLALVDLRLGTESGMDLLTRFQTLCPWMKSIVITAYASIDSAVEAMRHGAFDYLPKPFTHEQVLAAVGKVAKVRGLEQKVADLQEMLSEAAPETVLDSSSNSMQAALAMARKVADTDATILLRGESGTGKTIIARAIHSWSTRSMKLFGTISCPSLSPELLESELFGHAKGAFTGAVRDYPGRIASCEGGTLLLDEIGDLPLPIQAKLLRVLQEKVYERVGELETRRANVRFIAATNVDLESAISAGRFREDLFYRLNVIEIVIPPLRERRGDIIPLAQRFLLFFARNNHRQVSGLSDEAAESLKSHDWPGNVRELRNAVERAVLLCTGDRLEIDCFPLKVRPANHQPNVGDPVPLEEIEQRHIRAVLRSAKSIDEACRILDMDSVTLWRKRKKYGI